MGSISVRMASRLTFINAPFRKKVVFLGQKRYICRDCGGGRTCCVYCLPSACPKIKNTL